MAITYENRRRDGDTVRVTVHQTIEAAVADLGQSILDGDDDYDGTFVILRNVHQRVAHVDVLDISALALEWAEESRQDARDEREDPYPASHIGKRAA